MDVDLKALTSALQQKWLEEQQKRAQWGELGPIPNTLFGGGRIVAVHNQLLRLDEKSTYHDFLGHYIKRTLGEQWWAEESAKPDNQAHPVIRWDRKVHRFQLQHTCGDGVQSAPRRGVIGHYYRLAFDLHTIEHQGLLQEQMVKRLIVAKQFQGARYEVVVCAAFARAAFDVRFEEAGKGPDKLCEFVATHRTSGAAYAVEAKSRHRAGVLGQPAAVTGNARNEPKVRRLLIRALQKVTDLPRVICIDVNFPQEPHANPLTTWVLVVRKQLKLLEAEGYGPAIVFFTNSPLHYLGDDELARGEAAMMIGLNDSRFQAQDMPSVEKHFPGLLRTANAFAAPIPEDWG